MRRLTIAVLDDYQHAARDLLPLQLLATCCDPDIRVYHDAAGSDEELIRRAGQAEVVVAMRERSRFPASVLGSLASTRLLVTTGARNAAIDLEAARANGIEVVGTAGDDASAAELTWALLMAVARRIPQEDAALREGRWGTTIGELLEGSTLGVLGIGKVGGRVAAYGTAFGMRVLAHSRSLTPERAAASHVEAADRQQLFEESDFVSVHLPLNETTRGSVGAQELGWLGPRSYLINTARGPVVDEAALRSALASGGIAGAGLDVFDVEPLPAASPLLDLPNLVLTGHVGYVTSARYARYYQQVGEQIAAYATGRAMNRLN